MIGLVVKFIKNLKEKYKKRTEKTGVFYLKLK
jgi:hypothetical protein